MAIRIGWFYQTDEIAVCIVHLLELFIFIILSIGSQLYLHHVFHKNIISNWTFSDSTIAVIANICVVVSHKSSEIIFSLNITICNSRMTPFSAILSEKHNYFPENYGKNIHKNIYSVGIFVYIFFVYMYIWFLCISYMYTYIYTKIYTKNIHNLCICIYTSQP